MLAEHFGSDTGYVLRWHAAVSQERSCSDERQNRPPCALKAWCWKVLADANESRPVARFFSGRCLRSANNAGAHLSANQGAKIEIIPTLLGWVRVEERRVRRVARLVIRESALMSLPKCSSVL